MPTEATRDRIISISRDRMSSCGGNISIVSCFDRLVLYSIKERSGVSVFKVQPPQRRSAFPVDQWTFVRSNEKEGKIQFKVNCAFASTIRSLCNSPLELRFSAYTCRVDEIDPGRLLLFTANDHQYSSKLPFYRLCADQL